MNEKEIKGGFQFWPNYYRAVKNASNPAQFSLAIAAFFYEDIEPDFSSENDQLLWDLIRPSIACSRRQSNRGQGAPVGNNNNPRGVNQYSNGQSKGQSSGQSAGQTNRNRNRNRNENVEIEDMGGVDAPASTPQQPHRRKFVKPTPEEVREYCREKGFPIDAERFCDHYESNGWVVGKTPMRDWKAAVRTWARKEKDSQGVNTLPQQPGNIIGPDEILKMMNNNG